MFGQVQFVGARSYSLEANRRLTSPGELSGEREDQRRESPGELIPGN